MRFGRVGVGDRAICISKRRRRAGRPLHKKAIRWKKSLQQRLESLIALRRHIEAIKHRLELAPSSKRKDHLAAMLARREQRYQAGIQKLRRGHRKLARLERELRSSETGSVG